MITPYEQVGPTPRHADRWLAVLRVVVGLWFLKSAGTKLSWFLLGGFLPLPTASERWINFLPKRLVEYAETNRLDWYHDFLLNAVIPGAPLFAQLTAFGEVVVGLGLTLGLVTRPTSAIGLAIMANYLLATYWVGFCQQGFHILLITCMVAFFATPAGRTWGLDGWLIRRFPRSFLSRSPLT